MIKYYCLIIYCLICICSIHGQRLSNPDFEHMLSTLLEHSVNEKVPSQIDTTKQYLFLDARASKEYEVSHIADALRIGYKDFDKAKLSGIGMDTPIVVYCSVGYRSEKIAAKLQKLGYSDVVNLYGGIFEWKENGGKLYNHQEVLTDSVHTFDKNWARWLQNGIPVF